MPKSLTAINQSTLQMESVDYMKNWYQQFVQFSSEIMKENLDYGLIPGTGSKPTLLKPGAEKLRFVYGLGTEEEMVDKTVDLSTGYISYTYKVSVKGKNGLTLAECEGNCNSYETKFRYLWVSEDRLPAGIDKTLLEKRSSKVFEFQFAINKAETTGKYGKPAEYWQKWKEAIANGTAKLTTKVTNGGKTMNGYEMGGYSYKIQNPDIMGMQNTIMKMAQKRAFVGAILLATGASEFYTQDIEDMVETGISDAVVEPAVEAHQETAKQEVQEGEVVSEPVKPFKEDAEAHQRRCRWIADLVGAGKIKLNQDPYKLTPSQSLTIMENYRKFIGK